AICQDLTVSLVDNHEYLLSAQELDGGSTDACEISSYSILEGTFPSDYTTVSEMTLTCEQYGLSNFTQTLVVTDNLGGTAICVSQITVLDAAPPTLPDYPTATAYLNQQGSVDLDHEDLTFESTDCTPASEIYYIWNPSHDDYDCSHLGTVQTLEFTATDTSDNTTTGTMYITILDTLAPTVIPQNVTINLDATGSATIDYSAFIASASDNCLSEAQIISGYSWDESQLPLNVSCEHIGSHEITLLSAPVAHESQLPTVTATVTIRDGAGPEIVCNDNTIHVGDGVYHFTLDELPIESVSDLCYDTSELTYNWKYNNPNVFFNCNDVGVDEFAWIDVTDPENNTTRCYYTLTIADTVAPILNCINRTVYFNSETSSYTFTPEEIFGNLSSTCVSFIPGNGTVAFAEGTNPFMDCSDVGNPRTVTLIYTPDDGSDQLSCTSTLTVKNPSWPNITCPSGTIHLTATYEDCGAIYDYEYNAWDDVCPDDISVNLAQGLPSGSTFPIGDNLVRWEVTNNANRTTSCTFLVRVLHPSAAPTLECPENYTVTIGEEECNTIIDTSAIFHYEDCYVANTQFSGPAMGSSLAPGSYNFGFRTRNVNTNNSSQCTFTVTIEGGSTAPTALCKDTTVVLTSNNITLNPDYIDDGSYSLCSNISIRFIIPNKLNCSDLGSQTVTLMVRDNNFVATTCESTLTLVPKEPDCQDISVSIDDTGIASITPEDILVPDNVCNNQATLSLDQTEFDCTQLGDQIVTLTRSVSSYSNTCTATVTVDDPVGNCPSTDLLVNAKTFLEGPYDSASGLMNDDLRILDLIPSTEPYSNNGETVDASVLAIEGGDAIVDWVVIELRSELDNTEVLHSRSALLQRDGDVVDTDGVSPVGFADADPGHYYIAIRHRNHLGLMTATTRGLSTTATMIDFSADTEAVYGTNSRFNLTAGVWGMYGADPDKSGMINASDRSMTWNDRNSSGYLDSDCNLDGITNASDRSATWNNRNIGGTLPE
ncbi:MAG: HYR domain-containing protein, partial [Bacteroidota bacterium]